MMMKIQNMKIDDVKPYDKNPRDNEDAVGGVAESIKQFGFQSPIIVDKNNVIIAGHTRLKAAKKLGLKEVPVIYAKHKDGSWLSDEEAKALRLADNKTGELADWDMRLLDDELADIADIDMSDFGFGEELSFPETSTDNEEVEEDNFNEEPPANPVAKTGQIYQLGEHFVMCGDSTDPKQVKKLMRGGYS